MENAHNAPTEKQHWIEFMRILFMLWIILFHFTDHSNINMCDVKLSFNWLILAFAAMGGSIGNGIFVLISGYLLYDKDFKLSRLLRLYAEVYTYSLISLVICIVFDLQQLGIVDIVRSLIPISGNVYWFISAYFLLSLLSPFINLCIRKIDFRMHVSLILILFIFCSIIPTCTNADWMNSGDSIEIFILLYLLGALIRKYKLFNKISYKALVILFIVLFAVIISETLFRYICPQNMNYFLHLKRSPMIISAILLFVLIKNINIKLPKAILTCASSVFGVYLIHIGKLYPLFYKRLFDITEIINSPWFIIYILTYTLCIFAICIFIDQIRLRTIEKLYLKHIDKLAKYASCLFQKAVDKIILIFN